MTLRRCAGLAFAFLVALGAAACGHKSHAAGHAAEAATPAPAPPTPDTTPIEALRTPAGIALKVGEAPRVTPVAPTPSPK